MRPALSAMQLHTPVVLGHALPPVEACSMSCCNSRHRARCSLTRRPAPPPATAAEQEEHPRAHGADEVQQVPAAHDGAQGDQVVGSLAAGSGRVVPARPAGASAGERPHSPPPARRRRSSSSSMYDRQQLSHHFLALISEHLRQFSPSPPPFTVCNSHYTIHQGGYSSHACLLQGRFRGRGAGGR